MICSYSSNMGFPINSSDHDCDLPTLPLFEGTSCRHMGENGQVVLICINNCCKPLSILLTYYYASPFLLVQCQ